MLRRKTGSARRVFHKLLGKINASLQELRFRAPFYTGTKADFHLMIGISEIARPPRDNWDKSSAESPSLINTLSYGLRA